MVSEDAVHVGWLQEPNTMVMMPGEEAHSFTVKQGAKSGWRRDWERQSTKTYVTSVTYILHLGPISQTFWYLSSELYQLGSRGLYYITQSLVRVPSLRSPSLLFLLYFCCCDKANKPKVKQNQLGEERVILAERLQYMEGTQDEKSRQEPGCRSWNRNHEGTLFTGFAPRLMVSYLS